MASTFPIANLTEPCSTRSRLPFRFRDVDHGHGTAVPVAGDAAVHIPGNVQLVSLRIDSGGERPDGVGLVLLLEVRRQEGDHLALPGLDVELDHRGAVVLGTTVGTGNVIQIRPVGSASMEVMYSFVATAAGPSSSTASVLLLKA